MCVGENLLNTIFVFYFHSFWQEGYLSVPLIAIRGSNSHFEDQKVFSPPRDQAFVIRVL